MRLAEKIDALPDERLDSWKEIAAYLKRDVRTVQRWETSLGLPVHRYSPHKTGPVYAFREEIESWLRCRWTAAGEGSGKSRRLPLEAVELYLKGRYHWNRRTSQSLFKAIEYYERALRVAPHYALAHVGMADVYVVLGGVILGTAPPSEAMPKARIAAQRALEFDPSLGEAHAALAFVNWMYDYDWMTAERGFEKAIALNPRYATAHHWHGVFLAHLGKTSEGLAEIERALRLDPLSLQIHAAKVQILYFGRQFERAIEAARTAIDFDANFATTRLMLALAYKECGMCNEALAEAELAVRLSNGSSPALACLAGCCAASGQKVEAETIVTRLEETSTQKYVDAYVIAWVRANLREREVALELLERARVSRSSYIPAIKTEPCLDFLRADRRFQEIQRRVGLL